jgi:hypothetical protein
VSTSPHDQVNLIQEGYEAASLAKKELAENHNFIRNELSSAHGFIAIPGLPPGLIPGLPPGLPPQAIPSRRQQQRHQTNSFMSPAETTISGKTTPACAGCGDPGHMQYYDKKTKTILCPKQDQPEVQARANTWLSDFRARAKQRRADKSRSTKAFVSQILAQLQQRKGEGSFNKHEHIVLISTIVLAASSNLPPYRSKSIHRSHTSNCNWEHPTRSFNPQSLSSSTLDLASAQQTPITSWQLPRHTLS